MGVDGCNTSWESSWRIIGSKGSAVWDGTNAPYAEVLINRVNDIPEFDKFTPTTKWDGKEQHFGCLDEMFGAFLAGEDSQTDAADNYKSMSMVFASLESAESGKTVRVIDEFQI
jgi:predicted dehydrogenase